MANLIGYLQGSRGSVHRLGGQVIHSDLRTWTHGVYTWLDKDGGYKVEIYKLHQTTPLKVIEGNIKDLT